VRVASFCSLPIALIPWTGAEPMLSVVVKATFSLATDGEAPLASEQEPLRIDEPDPLSDAAGLRYASDFAPQKVRADVLVVGHAHAPTRVNTIPIRMTFDVLDKQFVARSAEAATRIPLVARHLRTNETPNASPVAVGPRSAWSPERIAFGGAELGSHGAPLHALGANFDFQFFNSAPIDQQVGVLRPNGVMTLDGLMPGGTRRHVWLPGHRPRVFHFGDRGPGERVPEIPLACDTLWIDTDRAICVLVWRGVVARSRAADPPTTFVLSLEPRGAARGWTVLRDALGSARWEDALTPPDFSSDRPDHDGDAAFAESISAADLVSVDGTDGETLTVIRPPSAGEPSTVNPPSSGEASTQVDSFARTAVPDEALAPLFVPSGGALNLVVPANPDPWSGPTQKYVPIRQAADDEPTLLRGDKCGEDDCVTIPSNAASASGGASDELLSIEAYADLQVELSMRRDARDEILEAHGVSLASFREAERHYAAALAAEASRGGAGLSTRLDAALERARRRLAERG
jgi:Uncharacterized protein conserved in bacteria (DUF2169)